MATTSPLLNKPKGLATYAKPFVENGRLLSYVLSTYSGRKLGMPSTANAALPVRKKP